MKRDNEITITNDTYQCLKHKTRENKKYLINNKNKYIYIYILYILKKVSLLMQIACHYLFYFPTSPSRLHLF